MATDKKPINGKLIVEMVNNEQTTKTGIIITESFESPTQKTKIIAVGPNCKNEFKVGDYAYIARHAGFDIGFDQLVIVEDQVLYTCSQ